MAKKTVNNLAKKFWSQTNYYGHAAQSSNISDHAGLLAIAEIGKRKKKILEIGCGEGSKLSQIGLKSAELFGVDISEQAIKLAKKKFPKINFLIGDSEKLPFESNFFDLTYSAFTLEHLENPQKVIEEQIRVTKKRGKLAFIAPNFGAPNRANPCFTGNRTTKLLSGFVSDLLYIFKKNRNLNWLKVKPRIGEEYQLDFDTQVEPYLLTLKKFLTEKNVEILEVNSFWTMELANANSMQKILRFLGEKLKIYPFTYWGPHLFVVGEKP